MLSPIILAASITCCGNSVEYDTIVDAIYRVEGGPKARVAYGILSVKVANIEEARKVCFNTVRNNSVRWINDGQRGCYFDYLADRYCPSEVDAVGNKNWKKNIKRILNHK